MHIKYLICGIFLAIGFACEAQTIVKVNDPDIRYSGRMAMTDSTAELSWPATCITVNFSGTRISAVLKDERSDNNYNVNGRWPGYSAYFTREYLKKLTGLPTI